MILSFFIGLIAGFVMAVVAVLFLLSALRDEKESPMEERLREVLEMPSNTTPPTQLPVADATTSTTTTVHRSEVLQQEEEEEEKLKLVDESSSLSEAGSEGVDERGPDASSAESKDDVGDEESLLASFDAIVATNQKRLRLRKVMKSALQFNKDLGDVQRSYGQK